MQGNLPSDVMETCPRLLAGVNYEETCGLLKAVHAGFFILDTFLGHLPPSHTTFLLVIYIH
jgi:hypothetical protein